MNGVMERLTVTKKEGKKERLLSQMKSRQQEMEKINFGLKKEQITERLTKDQTVRSAMCFICGSQHIKPTFNSDTVCQLLCHTSGITSEFLKIKTTFR